MLPVHDAHLPRHSRKHPYRPAAEHEVPEVRADIDRIVRSVVDMAFQQARRVGAPVGWREDDVEEAAWYALGRFATFTLPRFDRDKMSKPSTLAAVALRNACVEFRRLRATRSNRLPVECHPIDERAVPGRDLGADVAVDRWLAQVARNAHAEGHELALLVPGGAERLTHNTRYRARKSLTAKLRRAAADIPVP